MRVANVNIAVRLLKTDFITVTFDLYFNVWLRNSSYLINNILCSPVYVSLTITLSP